MTTEAKDDFDAAFAEAAKEAEASVQAGAPADDDTSPGATGDDTAPAATGGDTVKGATGDDTAPAATGGDTVKGATGDDTAPAATGGDTVKGATGDDTAPAAAGGDTVKGATGDDTVPAPKPAPAKPEVVEETPEQKKAREDFEASLQPYKPSEEETKALEKFRKDFPEESVAIDAMLKSRDRTVNAQLYQAVQAVLKQVNGVLAPVAASTQEITRERHFSAIRAVHSDYDAVVAKIPDWINKQPAYLRPAMQRAYDEGSAQDVIDLVAGYKAAVKPAAPADLSPKPAPVAKPSGAADLEPVGGRRSAPNLRGAPDPNDFDGAFNEAAKALEAAGR